MEKDSDIYIKRVRSPRSRPTFDPIRTLHARPVVHHEFCSPIIEHCYSTEINGNIVNNSHFNTKY